MYAEETPNYWTRLVSFGSGVWIDRRRPCEMHDPEWDYGSRQDELHPQIDMFQ